MINFQVIFNHIIDVKANTPEEAIEEAKVKFEEFLKTATVEDFNYWENHCEHPMDKKAVALQLDAAYKYALKESEGDTDHIAWAKLYDFVFSDDISRRIHYEFADFEWYDPDTTYYEDVTAFIKAFKEFADVSGD